MIRINTNAISGSVSSEQLNAMIPLAVKAQETLHKGDGKGNDFLGWLDLPSQINMEMIREIETTATKLKQKCDFVVVVGIGGSYLGAKAIIDALNSSFDWLQTNRQNPVILYAGHNIGQDYLHELQSFLVNKRFGIINISKSGTTTEPALAFRLLKKQLEEQSGKSIAKQTIVAITDASRGALRKLADIEGYKTFVIADNIGGRFSVLSPVGLLPIAVAGHDVQQFVAGAVEMQKRCAPSVSPEKNPAIIYASARNALYQAGKKIEILANYHPKLHYIAEWWKQLYGESEGKENKGIFPAAVDFTTDLHSMGQWIQDGERTIFETVISVNRQQNEVVVEKDNDNLDGLNYLAGKPIDHINKMAELGTRIAHVDGGVPNMIIELPEVSAYYLGQLIYLFEKACGISGYILGVNPFDQLGVEDYKANMFALLEKPGFEEQTKAIKSKI